MKNTWFVYILRCVDGSLYTGISNQVEERIKRHNAGKGAAYTRSHRPVVLVWKESMVSESAARKREAEIKKWTRNQKLILIKTRPIKKEKTTQKKPDVLPSQLG